jgi:hypothetical protein
MDWRIGIFSWLGNGGMLIFIEYRVFICGLRGELEGRQSSSFFVLEYCSTGFAGHVIVTGTGLPVSYSSSYDQSWTTTLNENISWYHLTISKGGPYALLTGNVGASWTAPSAAPTGISMGIGSISSDGKYIAAACASYVCISLDGGVSRMLSSNVSAHPLSQLVASGNVVSVCDTYARFYQSVDYGQTFLKMADAPSCSVITASVQLTR